MNIIDKLCYRPRLMRSIFASAVCAPLPASYVFHSPVWIVIMYGANVTWVFYEELRDKVKRRISSSLETDEMFDYVDDVSELEGDRGPAEEFTLTNMSGPKDYKFSGWLIGRSFTEKESGCVDYLEIYESEGGKFILYFYNINRGKLEFRWNNAGKPSSVTILKDLHEARKRILDTIIEHRKPMLVDILKDDPRFKSALYEVIP